jgi:lipoprotein-anchoring transpeptidase ErfK/SrfK
VSAVPSSTYRIGVNPNHVSIPQVIVAFATQLAPGTIVVNTTERRLYLVIENGTALRYGIGRPGFAWIFTLWSTTRLTDTRIFTGLSLHTRSIIMATP